MMTFARFALFGLLLLPHGCDTHGHDDRAKPAYPAKDGASETIALYEAWFGHPRHISVGYNSQDPDTIRRQIRNAKAMAIHGFVVDWYGSREPFIDKSYAAMQKTAGEEHFAVAMMYDETNDSNGATEQAILDLNSFHDRYLAETATGHGAYLTYDGHPLIFIFPTSGHTDWMRVRTAVAKWSPTPLLINENLPGADASAFDGFYPWISPGKAGWSADGSNWGEAYLTEFYGTMQARYPEKMIVGAEWASFDDSKAKWGLNRHIAARCGETFADTRRLIETSFPAHEPPAFVLVETCNDHEEGTAIEDGLPSCAVQGQGKMAAPSGK